MKKINASLKLVAFLCVTAIFVFNSCKKDKDEKPEPVIENAIIAGRVLTPSNVVVGSASVRAGKYSTLSDKNGNFQLTVAPGDYTLIISTGGGHVFKTELNVTAKANETVNIPLEQSTLTQIKPLAFIPGAWDQIETIIIDTLGYTAVPITVADLDNMNYIKDFGGLFFNCGSGWILDSLKYTNLNTYVNNWGSVYASDFAVEYLTGDGNWRMANPNHSHGTKNGSHQSGYSTMTTCMSPLAGGFLPDSSLCSSKSGSTGTVYNAHIYDPNLINLLGKDSMDVIYDLGGWEVISVVDAPFSTIIEGFTYPGIGPLAVNCDLNGTNVGGKIFYTTFHNHPQGNVSSDVKKVLQYFILNL